MNKKLYLKPIFELILIEINIFCFILFASDCNDLFTFIRVHLVVGIIFIINSLILFKYGKSINENE